MIVPEEVRVVSPITTPFEIVLSIRLEQGNVIVIPVRGPIALAGISVARVSVRVHVVVVNVPNCKPPQRIQKIETSRLAVLDQ